MSCLTPNWETKRCLMREAQVQDFGAIASILTDNLDAVNAQGGDIQLEPIAWSLLRHGDLPHNSNPFDETTVIVADKATRQAIAERVVRCDVSIP